jgi:hypothetical protein
MRRLLSVGPPNYATHETYKSGLDREPPEPNLSKGWPGVLLPPGGCLKRGDGGVHAGACEGAVCGCAARGCAGFDAVDE